MRDLDNRVQITALDTIGVLGNAEAAPDVRYAFNRARNVKIQRAALGALAMFGQAQDRPIFEQYSNNSDAELRAAALEGLGRVREPADNPLLQTSFDEPNTDWRVHLAAAFALVSEGNVSTAEFSPLLYLVENLDARVQGNTAAAYLTELIRRQDVRQHIRDTLEGATKYQKIALCSILGSSRKRRYAAPVGQTGGRPRFRCVVRGKTGVENTKGPQAFLTRTVGLIDLKN